MLRNSQFGHERVPPASFDRRHFDQQRIGMFSAAGNEDAGHRRRNVMVGRARIRATTEGKHRGIAASYYAVALPSQRVDRAVDWLAERDASATAPDKKPAQMAA